MKNKIITIFGGTGFVGKNLINKLVKLDVRIKIISRNPTYHENLRLFGTNGQVEIIYGDLNDKNSIENIIKNTDVIINLVGILFPKKQNNFTSIHSQGAEIIAILAQQYNIKNLIHISALSIDKAPNSIYARSKLNGEKAILAAYPSATILRPSVIFGNNDNFINMLAKLIKLSPIFPLFGGGKNKLQPVYVSDVCDAIIYSIFHKKTKGKIYELGGPKIFTFKEIIQYICKILNKKRFLLCVPYFIANIQAFFMQLLPNPLITNDQVKLLKIDNVVSDDSLNFKDMNIEPKSLEAIVPRYLF